MKILKGRYLAGLDARLAGAGRWSSAQLLAAFEGGAE